MDKLITIDSKGQVLTLYADDLPELGKKRIYRASQVEFNDTVQAWTVKLSNVPENGVLGGKYLAECNRTVLKVDDAMQFTSRADALLAEVEFITRNILGGF